MYRIIVSDCNFDGGDCCTACVNTTYCLECVCHQSNTIDIQEGKCHFKCTYLLGSFSTNINAY